MPVEAAKFVGKELRISATGSACAITAARDAGDGGGEKKLGTFKGNAYTGAPMRPEGWKLPVVVDLDGVRVPSQHRPALRQHDHNQIVGHTTGVDVTPEGVLVEGVFSGEEQHAKKVTDPAKNGFQWQLSIGANPVRTELLDDGEEAEVNGHTVTGPLVISRETELGEISFVPLGADGNTSATVQASNRKGSAMFRKMLATARAEGNIVAAKYSDEDIEKMTEEEAKAALQKCMKGDDDPDVDADDETDVDAEDGDDDFDDDTDEGDKPAKSSKRTGIKAGKVTFSATIERELRASRKAAAAEVRRVNEIKARCQAHVGAGVDIEVNGRKVGLIEHAIAAGWSAQRAELHALRASRPGPGVGMVPGGLAYSTSAPEVNEAVLEAAVLHAARHQFKLDDDEFYTEQTPDGKGTFRRVPLHLQRQAQGELRARYTDQVQQAAHSHFKGRVTLKEVLTLAAQAAGLGRRFDLTGENGVRDYLKAWDYSSTIRAEGSSTASISNILANVMNKFALQGYLFTEQAWREFCAIRPVNDFKPAKSINLLGDVMFKQLGPTGEIENATFTDQAFANQAAPFGRIGSIPWTHMVNDDLSILATVPQKIGQGAGLAVNDNIWTLMKAMAAGTVNGDDGNAFWRTSASTTYPVYKANKTSGGGSALSSTSLTTVKALFDNQTDPNGNPLGFDNMTPILLHGPSNWRTATELLQAAALVYGGGSAALQPNTNVWQGRLKPVMSRYVESARYVNSATAWWVLFNPVALAVIEVCFLNGQDTPAVLQAGPDYQFDKLGISIRGTMPFGSNQQNFRGGVYSVGA